MNYTVCESFSIYFIVKIKSPIFFYLILNYRTWQGWPWLVWLSWLVIVLQAERLKFDSWSGNVLINVSLSHRCFSPHLSPSFPLSKTHTHTHIHTHQGWLISVTKIKIFYQFKRKVHLSCSL